MRLIDADKFIEYCKSGLKDMTAVPYYADNIKAMTEVTESFIKDIQEQPIVEAIPIACLDLEKNDCVFSIQTDMAGHYDYEMERACRSALDWYATPRYKRCLEAAKRMRGL